MYLLHAAPKAVPPIHPGYPPPWFHPLRFVQWLHSTPTIIFMLWLPCDPDDVPWSKMMVAVAADVVMIVTGLLAICSSGAAAVAAAMLSFAAFALVLYYLSAMLLSSIASSQDSDARTTLRVVLVLTLLTWSAFPLVWSLARAQLITPAVGPHGLGDQGCVC
ncbi:hypothetical protein V8C86DRAFT_83160 [Haematococcus lacustris]